MFEQAFKNIDDILRKDAGASSELDYTEQTSWVLFLKYLDALEQDKAIEAALEKKVYSFILDESYRWNVWAAPKNSEGKIDHNKTMICDDLKEFVDQKLFPYLKSFKQRATGPNTIEYKIGEIFGEIKNKIQSGYNLREVLEIIDGLRFRSQTEKHELSHLYEAKIKNMGNAGRNAGRNGGEYYTPRPLIRAIVAVTAPRLGSSFIGAGVKTVVLFCEKGMKTRKAEVHADTLQCYKYVDFREKSDAAFAEVLATAQAEALATLRDTLLLSGELSVARAELAEEIFN